MVRTIKFTSNARPSLGVEIELQLVDEKTMELNSVILDILEVVPKQYHEWIKPELMQCYIEINSKVGSTVSDIREDLRRKIKIVNEAARECGSRVFWAGTHPFSVWMDQKVTPNERYHQLLEKMQDTARRIVTFGMHVHVGVDSGDKAIMVVDKLMRYLPVFLSLSVNSPFWVGRNTGLQSQRIKIMEQLPTAGLPPFMRNYSEYCWLVKESVKTGFLNSIREIWWDVRPHPGFGTVEVRICDLPPSLDEVLALAALIQCLISRLSDDIDEGIYQHDTHPSMVKQNKWKACRYGLDADLVDPTTHKSIPARKTATVLTEMLHDYAVKLDCVTELNHIFKMVQQPTGAERQIALYNQTGDLVEVVRRMIEENPQS